MIPVSPEMLEFGRLIKFIHKAISDSKDDALDFIQKQLAETQPRNIYHEVLELSMTVLSKISAKGIKFKAPGPIPHAC